MTQTGKRIQGGLHVGHDLGAEFGERVGHSGEGGGEGTVWTRASDTRHQNGVVYYYKEFKVLGRG